MFVPDKLVYVGSMNAGQENQNVSEELQEKTNGDAYRDWLASEDYKKWLSGNQKFNRIGDIITREPYFAYMSAFVRKRLATEGEREKYKTAAMCYNRVDGDFEIVFNPSYYDSLNNDQVCSLIYHELFHLSFGHVTSCARKPHLVDNCAKDGAINSIIEKMNCPLPNGWIVPGRLEKVEDNPKIDPLVAEAMAKFRERIASWPKLQSSDWYYRDLMKWASEQGYSWNDDGLNIPGVPKPYAIYEGGDQHEMWQDEIPEEIKDQMKDKIRAMMKGAVNKCKNNGQWGHLPDDIRQEIEARINDRVDWQRLLQFFVGSVQVEGRRSSFKKINRKYPLIHPGFEKITQPNIAVCIDQSGSVDDEQLEMIFGSLRMLSRSATFWIVPFDATVSESNIFKWQKGTTPKLHRVRAGGTDFDAVTNYMNQDAVRRKYNGYIICTDGECSKPNTSFLRRAWVVTPGHKLMFSTHETVISMDDQKRDLHESWR